MVLKLWLPVTCGVSTAFGSAYNSAGEDVWDNGASRTLPGQITCPPEPEPGDTWPAYYSRTQTLDWSQDACTLDPGPPYTGIPNPDCPGTQVPAGTYRIVSGYQNLWSTPSASVTITISG